MKNSISDQSFYIESEDEEDEKMFNRHEGEDDGNESDASDSSAENQQQNKPKGDYLSSLFPNAHISLGGFELNSPRLFALMTTVAVLPTVWLRDLSVLSYISAGGVVASILVVLLPVLGHAVFPNIYTSMAKPNQFPSILLACFGICSLLYAGTAIMGYTMFGEATESQFTLNMPKDLIASKIAVWAMVCSPYLIFLTVCSVLIFIVGVAHI
ncbi:hypothetical protein REPUB_Repub13aG0049700 [Reevesia pubescens]